MGFLTGYTWRHRETGTQTIHWGVPVRILKLNEQQEEALASCLVMIADLGVPDHIDEKSFDELFDTVTEPTPWDYD